MARMENARARATGRARSPGRARAPLERLECRRLLSGTGTITGTVYGTGGQSATVYLDANGNGKLDPAEVRTTTKAADGTFTFARLAAGDYAVRQVDPGGYVQVVVDTTAGGEVAGDGVAGLVRVAAGGTATVTFSDARNVGSAEGLVYFNGVHAGQSGVTVFADLNDDGKLDAGEPSDVTGPDAGSALMNGYLLNDLPVGNVVIRQVVPAGYVADGGVTSQTVGIGVADTTEVGAFNDLSTGPIGTKLAGTAIGTGGSYKNGGHTIARALDGNLGTYFDGPTANGDTVGLDLGAAATISSVAYASRSGYAGRMNGGYFQASNSRTFDPAGDTVTLYAIPAGANPPSSSLTARGVTTFGTYRYVRYVAPAGSYGDAAEVQFYGTPAPKQLAGTTFGTAGSYGNGGNTVAKATDGSLATFFDGPTASGDVVGIDLGSAKVVAQIGFAPRSGYAGRMVGGYFQASNSSTFATGNVTVYTVTSAPASGSLTTVATGTAAAYRYWRYVAPNGSYGHLAEFELFG